MNGKFSDIVLAAALLIRRCALSSGGAITRTERQFSKEQSGA